MDGTNEYARCPVADTQVCRQAMGTEDNNALFHFWSQNDFHNFFKAFFRNQKLVHAFIKPHYLTNDAKSKDRLDFWLRLLEGNNASDDEDYDSDFY